MFTASEQNEHLLALRSLCSLQPRYPLERSLEAIESLGPAESSRFLDALAMRSLAVRRLASVAAPSGTVSGCIASLSPRVERANHMRSVLGANLKRLEEIATGLGLVMFGGKGISARATYPDPSVRDFNDLDIFVSGHDSATKLSRVLRDDLGYRYQEYELPWFKIDPQDGLLYGQIALVAPEAGADLLNVDIHFGDYSVRHCGRLGIGHTFSAAPGLHMVAPEENLACIVNNAAGDYFITAKDTNDLLMALSLDTFDVDRFVAILRRSHLGGFFGSIAETLRASTTLTEDQQNRLRAVRPPRAVEPAPRPDRPDMDRRCVGTTLHAFSVRRPAGLLPAVAVAAGAFSYYRRPLKLCVTPPGQRSKDKPVQYNPWTCIRLVPLELALRLVDQARVPGQSAVPLPEQRSLVNGDPAFCRYDTPAGTYFTIADEFFLATVRYRVAADAISHVAAKSASRSS